MYTAIVPARPQEEYLLEAVEGVPSQSCPPESVIAVMHGVGANSSAQRSGVRVQWRDDTVLFRGIHQLYSWVTHPGEGRSQLLSEIRALAQHRLPVDGNSNG